MFHNLFKFLLFVSISSVGYAHTFDYQNFSFDVNEPSKEQIESLFENLDKYITSNVQDNFKQITINNNTYSIFNIPSQYQESNYQLINSSLIKGYQEIQNYYQNSETYSLLSEIYNTLILYRQTSLELSKLRSAHTNSQNKSIHSTNLAKTLLYIQYESDFKRGFSAGYPYVSSRVDLNYTFSNSYDFFKEFPRFYVGSAIHHLDRITVQPNLYSELIKFTTLKPPNYVFQMLPDNQASDLEKYYTLLEKKNELKLLLDNLSNSLYEDISNKFFNREFHDVLVLSPIYIYIFTQSNIDHKLKVLHYYQISSNIENDLNEQISLINSLFNSPISVELDYNIIYDFYYLIENNKLSKETLTEIHKIYEKIKEKSNEQTSKSKS